MAREPAERFQSAWEFANALAALRARRIESTDLGPALRPATRPRRSTVVTLASGSDARRRRGEDASAAARGNAALPAQERRRPSSLGRLVFRSIVAVGAVTAAALALRSASRETRAPSIGHSARPTSPLLLRRDSRHGATQPQAGTGERLSGEVAAAATGPTRQTTLATPQVLTSLPAASTESSSGTSNAGQHPGQPKEVRPSRSVRPERAATAPRSTDEGSATRPPKIDEPLPASPHAPGVSPVME